MKLYILGWTLSICHSFGGISAKQIINYLLNFIIVWMMNLVYFTHIQQSPSSCTFLLLILTLQLTKLFCFSPHNLLVTHDIPLPPIYFPHTVIPCIFFQLWWCELFFGFELQSWGISK